MRLSTLIIVLVIVVGGIAFAWKEGYFGKAQEAASNSFSVHYSKGQSLYLTAKYEGAIPEFQRALELDPKDPEAPTALARVGDCYKELKQYSKAVEMYDRVLNEYPDYKMRPMVEQSREKIKGLY